MHRTLAATLIAAILLAAAAPFAEAKHRAGRGGGPDNAVPQSRAALSQEWARARAQGGYDNPIGVLGQIFRGEAPRAGQIQPPITPGPVSEGKGITIFGGRLD